MRTACKVAAASELLLLLLLSTSGVAVIVADDETPPTNNQRRRHLLPLLDRGGRDGGGTTMHTKASAIAESDDCSPRVRCNLNSTTNIALGMVFISQGRSGSSETMRILHSLLDNGTHGGGGYLEDAGSNSKQIANYFQHLNQEEHGSCWLRRLFCKKRKNRTTGLYGTKWKPYAPSWTMKQANETLEWLSSNTNIKVVLNVRNPLDVVISRQKHDSSGHVPPHCGPKDKACLKKHHEQESTLIIKCDNALLNHLKSAVDSNENAVKQLSKYKVPYVKVEYGRLLFPNPPQDASEWNKAMEFLSPGSQFNMTMDLIHQHMDLAATSSRNRSENMANYKELEEFLKGTPYEEYLYY